MPDALNTPTPHPAFPSGERRQDMPTIMTAAPTILMAEEGDSVVDANLLLIGEDSTNLGMLAAFLEQSGFPKTTTAHEPRRLLEVIDKTLPDIILIELQRAEIAELAPLEALRARDDSRNTPVILLSPRANEETRLRAIELGADVYLLKPVSPRELLLRLRNALNLISYQNRLAHYDPLTGLPNRALFLQRLDEALRRRTQVTGQAALLHINLDRFKQINEGLGHKMGDALLRAVAARLDGTLRSGDTLSRIEPKAQPNALAHLGGDEFTILSLRLRQADDAGSIARRILATMTKPFKLFERELYVTPSIGIAIYPDDGENAALLLKHAVAAMDQAKRSGGNHFEFCSSTINQRSLERLSLENALRKAVKQDELRLHYQPKVDVASGRLVGVEALMRWMHPSLGMVAPYRFIPVAEESGLILELGCWALQAACRQAKAWHEQGMANLHIAVNVSSHQFRQSGLVDMVAETLQESGLAPAALTLELTESCIMSNVESSIATMQALKGLGVDLSIDDFGTGFSSLSYLQRFPLDELKIDRSFIMALSGNNKGVALVSGIIGLADNLQLRTVAEGIETEEQLKHIRNMGCKFCQGYLFSKPVTAEQFVEFAANPSQPA